MAFTAYKRRAIRKYRRTPYKKFQFKPRRPIYRRRAFVRRQYRKNRTTQNNVRFTSINFFSERLVWPWNDKIPSANPPAITNTTFTFTMANLLNKNYQFLRNLIDYQYVKINYIAFKCTNLSHFGINRNDGNGGVTTIQGDFPIYVCWDLEQRLEDIADSKDFGQLLSQYPYSKRWSPKTRMGPTFLYRVPHPWKQYFRTDEFKLIQYTKTFSQFMSSLSGSTNIRAPSKMYFGVKDWFGDALPGSSTQATSILTNIEGKVYLGCTFRGRRLMSAGMSQISQPLSSAPAPIMDIPPVISEQEEPSTSTDVNALYDEYMNEVEEREINTYLQIPLGEPSRKRPKPYDYDNNDFLQIKS